MPMKQAQQVCPDVRLSESSGDGPVQLVWFSHLIRGSCPKLPHLSPPAGHGGAGYQGEGHQVEQGGLTHPGQQHHCKCHYHSQQIGCGGKERDGYRVP